SIESAAITEEAVIASAATSTPFLKRAFILFPYNGIYNIFNRTECPAMGEKRPKHFLFENYQHR
ncbi:hypothetical protein, partial [Salmonella enterica]|uniref:hypothetical protein n=1 Tax=Salmonella enterica TaxID=28901 RepID=UPI001C99E270